MKSIYDRTRMLIGSGDMERLMKSSVIVFGIGGVGGYVIEALTRAGLGKIGIVDFDVIDVTNINRQLIALHSTLGRAKTDVMAQRMKDINPEIKLCVHKLRLSQDTLDEFCIDQYDYIVDAIDDVKAKLLLISKAKELSVSILSSMGTGNKRDPSKFRIVDIKKTHACPLAKVMRKETRKMGITELKVLFSDEMANQAEFPEDGGKAPASISFVPAAAGLLIASQVVQDLLKGTDKITQI